MNVLLLFGVWSSLIVVALCCTNTDKFATCEDSTSEISTVGYKWANKEYGIVVSLVILHTRW
jgi:hypothetical protein